jgi:PncC family amidohydrolase
VSEQCVIEMAEGLLALSGTDLALSVSGIAGPDGGTEDKPVGLVWFGFASKTRPTQAVALRMTSWGRDAVRRRAAVSALLLASLYINGNDLLDTVARWQYI